MQYGAIDITSFENGLRIHTDINHKYYIENNLQCIAGMVSTNWVGYIVCNTLYIVFNMFVIYVGVNLQTIKLTLHNVI